MTLAERIKKARGNRLTQKELADAVGVSQPMISKLERGVTGETSLLIRIAKATGVRPEWLESEEGPMDAAPATPAPEAGAPTPGQSVERQSSVPDSQPLLDRARVETATALLTADLNTINRVRPVLGLPPIPPTARLIESGPIPPQARRIESGPIPPQATLVVPVGGDEPE